VKILMFGRGAIATIYGWALEGAGHNIEFYVRPGRAAEYGDTVHLDLVDGRRRPLGERVAESVPIRLRETLAPDDGFDLIVLSVSHHRLTAAAEFLAPRIGDATVLVFGNVWEEPLTAIGPLPVQQVVWGFPQAGGAFDDGTLHGVLLRTVLFGTFGDAPTSRGLAARAAFTQARLTIREENDFKGWLWVHFVADAGMHTQGLKLGTMSKLVGNRRGLREALLTSRELLPVLEARGIDLRRHRGSTLQFRVPAWLAAAVMGWATSHVMVARVSLEAHIDPNAAEPRAVCRDALDEAQRLGITTPRLEIAAP
jgi:2-dehydropantoate 2-reductase